MDEDEAFERGDTLIALEESSSASTPSPRAVIITGLSGSGKSTAMRALEDAGFFCIDNLPVPLLPKVLELAGGHNGEGRVPQQYAFAVDTRERNYLDHADQAIAQMRSEGVSVQVVFLEASDESLVRRYSETRRRHPMSDGGTVREGIERERERLGPLRLSADLIVDTTEHTVHTLKGVIQRVVARSTELKLNITVLSFGFKHGLPTECDLVFDVRFLPNPYFVEGLREMTGLDPVADPIPHFLRNWRSPEKPHSSRFG